MRWLSPILGLFLVAACGGSASFAGHGSPNVGGSAGKTNSDAAGSSAGGSVNVGTAGAAPASASGTGGEIGVAGTQSEAGASGGAAAGDGGDAGAAGQDSSCTSLDCLAGAKLVYWPDREWQRSSTSQPGFELSEADYTPKMGSAWDVKFSSDARQVVLTPRAGGDPVQGERDPQRTDRAWFDLALFAGGRFVVQVGPPWFQAEYTAYGSGQPIVSSTRGALTPR
ncbi:MAG TPA: hypothetical protein VFK05_38755 [Polyangiaceae bacterium]|nr:hypothetical protein [Polyangiaceae bacterium]